MYEFLRDDFAALSARYGGVVSTTFRNFPSFPQRYMERLEMPAADCSVRIEPLKPLTQPVLYTEQTICTSASSRDRARTVCPHKGEGQAA